MHFLIGYEAFSIFNEFTHVLTVTDRFPVLVFGIRPVTGATIAAAQFIINEGIIIVVRIRLSIIITVTAQHCLLLLICIIIMERDSII